jgi:hypothetical protein
LRLARGADGFIPQRSRAACGSPRCLRNRPAQAEVDEKGSDTQLTSKEKKELAELRRDYRRLKMEVEILERAATRFARENVLPNWSSRWSVNSPMTTLKSRWACRVLNVPRSEY